MSGWIFSRKEVADCCRRFGPALDTGDMVDLDNNKVDPVRLMWAFALTESIARKGGMLDAQPRFEPAYFSGKYSTETHQAQLNRLYGVDGARSYGNWQVMLCNCKGRFKPEDFQRCEVGAVAFLYYINDLIYYQKPPNITNLADAYNSGNWRDQIIPDEYVKRLYEHYCNTGGKSEMPL